MKQLFEMARFGSNLKIKKENVDVELHGFEDRIYPPHIHLYRTSERNRPSNKKSFSIELNFANFISTKELSISRVLIDGTNVNKKLFKKYLNYLDFITDFLFETPNEDYSNFEDNISVAISIFNDEADMSQLRKEDKKFFEKTYGKLFTNMKKEHKFVFVMLSMDMKIHPDFRKYFSKETKNLFPAAFK